MPLYYYPPHEKATFEYTVSVSPPPADSAVAHFHRQSPTGKVFKTEPLNVCGTATLTVTMTDFDVRRDSPVFIDFVFEKKHKKIGTPRQAQTHALPLAEPEPALIKGPNPYPGEEITLEIEEWGAVSYDRPGRPTFFREENPARIPADVKKQVRWVIDGVEQPTKGESIKWKPTDDQAGKDVPVEAFIKTKANGAKTTLKVITVKMVTPATDTRLYINQDQDETHRHGRLVKVKAKVEPVREGVPVHFELVAPATNRTGLATKNQPTLLATLDQSDGAPVQSTLTAKTDKNGIATVYHRSSTFGGDSFTVTGTTAKSKKAPHAAVVSSKKIEVWQKLYFDVLEMKRPTGGGVFEWKGAIQSEVIAAFKDAFVELIDTGKRAKGDYVRNFESVEDGFKWADKNTDPAGVPFKVHFCVIDSCHPGSAPYGPKDVTVTESATASPWTSAGPILPHDTAPGWWGTSFRKPSWFKKVQYQKADGTWADLDDDKVKLAAGRGRRSWIADLSGTGVTPTAAKPVPVKITYKQAFPAGGWGGSNALHLLICRGFYEDEASKGALGGSVDGCITTACIHEPGHALGLVSSAAPTHDATHSSHCTVLTCTMWWTSNEGNYRFHPESAAVMDACRARVKGGHFTRAVLNPMWKYPR